VQYGDYLWRALHGDLGVSTITHEPVFSRVHRAFPATIELSVFAMLLRSRSACPAGILGGAQAQQRARLHRDGRVAQPATRCRSSGGGCC
jgi:ABC-type dipeptide/oligopeptide/nickel transport system permease component